MPGDTATNNSWVAIPWLQDVSWAVSCLWDESRRAGLENSNRLVLPSYRGRGALSKGLHNDRAVGSGSLDS